MKTVEAFKKTLLASLGMLSLTQEKMQAVAKDLVDRGELTKEQAKRFVEALVERGRRENNEVTTKLTDEFQRLLDRIPLVTRSDLEALEERVRKLEGELSRRDSCSDH